MANMRLLCFIDVAKIEEFFEKIKNKYNYINKEFFDYFYKTYILNFPYNDKSWNFSRYYQINQDKDLYFFTNNISESTNRIFNMHFISNRKSFYSFRKCLIETLDYFNKKDEYRENKIQITRALYYYVKNTYNQDRLPLITFNDLNNIIKDYSKKLSIPNIDDNDNDLVNIDSDDIDYLINHNYNEFSSSNVDSSID